jgi:hypothetical protein
MVPLATTRSGFEAKVLVARLGADGILAQLQGGTVDSLYPVGAFNIFVDEDDLDRARELLEEGTGELTDEEDSYVESRRSNHVEWWMAVILIGSLVLFVALRIFSL